MNSRGFCLLHCAFGTVVFSWRGASWLLVARDNCGRRQIHPPRIVSAPSLRASPPENPDWSACAQSSPGGSSTPPRWEYTQPSGSQESLDPKSSGGLCRISYISSSQQGSEGLETAQLGSDLREGTQVAERDLRGSGGSVLQAWRTLRGQRKAHGR